MIALSPSLALSLPQKVCTAPPNMTYILVGLKGVENPGTETDWPEQLTYNKNIRTQQIECRTQSSVLVYHCWFVGWLVGGRETTTPFLVFSVTYTLCKGPTLDALDGHLQVSRLLIANMTLFVNVCNFLQ